MKNVQKVVSDVHGKRKCKQCGAVKPLVDFRPYHNSEARCHTCLVCESINGKRRYLEKKRNNGNITETEQDELDKIYRLYKILSDKGLEPPRVSPGKRGAESTVNELVNIMLSAFESEEEAKISEITTGATLEAYMDIVEKAETTEEAKWAERVIKNDLDRETQFAKESLSAAGRARIDKLEQALGLAEAYEADDGDTEVEEVAPVRSAAVPKVPTKPAFVDNTSATQRPEAAPVVPTQNEVYQVASAAVSGKVAPPSIEQARAEIVQWLTAELTDEPEYYLDVVYERLRDKWMPVISGTKGFFDEVRANSALKEDFSKLLRRFEDYEDAYWEDK